ncbi:hypothetical protein [Herbidospora daliensis]|uniref:hypothetical protein n=1 Tax=Herbidospora daliensis TaxID=295585 RepID=UPI000786594C|nr:hypothetical protein [Herbidospora daliensis]
MATFDRDAGLAEYHEALAKVNAEARDVRPPAHHRPRGIAIVLLGLFFLGGAAAGFYVDWYGPTYGRPATGTISAIEGRMMYVAFTTADGVLKVGSTKKLPEARLGEQRKILYLVSGSSPDQVNIWNPDIPPTMTLAVIFAFAGLGAVATGFIEFSGRAPWRYAVWLDERSITARSDRP